MNLDRAQLLAKELCDAIAPFCAPDQCVIAGSVRRKHPSPGDIEVVALPVLSDYDKVDGIIKLLDSLRFGSVKTGMFPARQTVIEGSTCKLEIYWQSKQSFGLNYFIRTGPAEYVARALYFWKTVTEGGYSEGAVLHLADGTPVPTLTELSVFDAFDTHARAFAEKMNKRYVPVKWLEPERRR